MSYPQLPCLKDYFENKEGMRDQHINKSQLDFRLNGGATSEDIGDATKEANNIQGFDGGALVSELNRLKSRLGLTGRFHINDLIRQACDEALYGFGFTGEITRFLPQTIDHRISGGFALGVGSTDRIPLTGSALQGSGANNVNFGVVAGMNAGTNDFTLYCSGRKNATSGSNQMVCGTGIFDVGEFGEEFSFNGSNNLQFAIEDAGGVTVIVSDGVTPINTDFTIFGLRNFGVEMAMWKKEGSGSLAKQAATSTESRDLDSSGQDSTMFGSPLGAGLSDDTIYEWGIIQDVVLTETQMNSIVNIHDFLAFQTDDTKRFGYHADESAGTNYYGLGSSNPTGTGTATWLAGDTFPSVSNQIGYAESSDLVAGVKIPLDTDKLTPVYNLNITATFLGKVALRLKLTGGACKDVDGINQDLLLNFTPTTVVNAGTATAIINGDTIEFTTAGTVFDLLIDSVFKFPCAEQGDASSGQTSYCVNDVTKTGIWQNDDLTMHSGTDDNVSYHNEQFGATKTGVFFIPAETSNDVSTNFDVLGAAISNILGTINTGFEMDATFDSAPELANFTATVIASIDLDFSYINSDTTPTDHSKDCLLFNESTLAGGYPAGERAKILAFTDN